MTRNTNMLKQPGLITVARLERSSHRNRKQVPRTTGFRKMMNTTMKRCKADPTYLQCVNHIQEAKTTRTLSILTT